MKSYKRDVLFINKAEKSRKKSEGTSEFLKALPKKLTVNVPKMYHASLRYGVHDTIFEEVSINPYTPSKDIEEFLGSEVRPVSGLEDIYKAMKEAIRKRWDNKAVHFIGHSSGYDSRIISKIIRELIDEGSISGEVYFVEALGETANSAAILALQGFKAHVYNKDSEPGKFHGYSFEFKSFYEKFNGISAFPVNQWYDAYKHMVELGQLPQSSRVQGFTGYGGNETMEYALRAKGFAWYFDWHHYLQLQHFRNYGGDWVHPYWDIDVLHAIRGAKHLLTKNRLAHDIANKMVPEAIHIPQQPTKALKQYRNLHPEYMAKAMDDYYKSWYGKQVPVKFQNSFEDYYEWWMHYNIASLCEHLIERNYNITLKGVL